LATRSHNPVVRPESTADESFSTPQQDKLRGFVAGGGALFVSGAEVLWDLDYRGGDADRAFADEVLGAALAEDDAGTTVAVGVGVLEGLDLAFGEVDGAPYPVEHPDVLATEQEILAAYAGGSPAAALAGSVALFGFPFECIGDEATRSEVASRLLPLLVPDYEPSAPEEGADTGLDTPDGLPPTLNRVPLDEPGACGCGGVPAAVVPVWALAPLVLSRRRRPVAGPRRVQ
jgi:hypothetical protein